MREIHRAVGLGGHDLTEHLLGKDRDPGDDEQLVAAHHALYATYFDRLPALDHRPGDLGERRGTRRAAPGNSRTFRANERRGGAVYVNRAAIRAMSSSLL